jgi:AmmeMemoRadiSam system protein A
MTSPAKNPSDISREEGNALISLAQRSIMQRLGLAVVASADLDALLQRPVFKQHRASFVTLKKAGQLRGCIGALTADEPLAANVSRNALSAAFHDPRFAPLQPAEWAQIVVEVSVLTPTQPLHYNAGEELPHLLRPGIDGVVLRKKGASATFLPQVWQQLARPEDFLAHLCLKAGLPADAWRQGDLEVEIYQVSSFKQIGGGG